MAIFHIIIAAMILSVHLNSLTFGLRPVIKRSMTRCMSMSAVTNDLSAPHQEFLTKVAKVPSPTNINILLELLKLRGEEIVLPTERKGLVPFLIPLSRNKSDNSLTCYIRWPTQKEGSPLQIVKTTEAGITLVSLDTNQLCHRIAAELDFKNDAATPDVIQKINSVGINYKSGDFMPMIKSGKFPSATPTELNLILDRFILSKVGSFPDCYERLAENFLATGSEVSAFVTCERAVSVFYGWGSPMRFNAMLMTKVKGREAEARDAARAALAMPLWTIANSFDELDKLAQLAGYTNGKILGDMHLFRSKEERKDEIGEGLSPAQVALDQAAHLMDAVATGSVPGGWEESRQLLADKYIAGGYPEMAEFILA